MKFLRRNWVLQFFYKNIISTNIRIYTFLLEPPNLRFRFHRKEVGTKALKLKTIEKFKVNKVLVKPVVKSMKLTSALKHSFNQYTHVILSKFRAFIHYHYLLLSQC